MKGIYFSIFFIIFQITAKSIKKHDCGEEEEVNPFQDDDCTDNSKPSFATRMVGNFLIFLLKNEAANLRLVFIVSFLLIISASLIIIIVSLYRRVKKR